MTTIDGNVRLTRHVADLDDDGHDINGVRPAVMYAECYLNAPVGSTYVDWNYYYDHTFADLSLVIPANMGLLRSFGYFEATEPGLWLVNVSVELAAAPGVTGDIHLVAPSYGSPPLAPITPAQAASRWTAHWTLPMLTGEGFSLVQNLPSGSGLTYATVDIIRVAQGFTP